MNELTREELGTALRILLESVTFVEKGVPVPYAWIGATLVKDKATLDLLKRCTEAEPDYGSYETYMMFAKRYGWIIMSREDWDNWELSERRLALRESIERALTKS